MPAKRWSLQLTSKSTRLWIMAAQTIALVAAWVIWNPAGAGMFGPALFYVLSVWIVAEGITFWMYLAFSMAPFSDLLAASLCASASAMWLVPGALLLAARSQIAVTMGVAAVIHSSRLLVLNRAPKGKASEERRRAVKESAPLLFRYQPQQPLLSRRTVATMSGALLLQIGVYALAGEYPMLAAVSFAAVTAIWMATSVASGAIEARTADSVPYSGTGVLLTLLLTVTFTAVLMYQETALEEPLVAAGAAETLGAPESPGITKRLLQRMAHVPPMPVGQLKTGAAAEARQTSVSRAVDPSPAIGAKDQNGIPGVVLRPKPKPGPRLQMVAPGRPARLSTTESLSIPFTGEYQLYRTSSGKLPAGATVETGTPLDSVYGTTNGGSMETVAVQTFEPPIDLTHCSKVLVAVTNAEKTPVLVLMQLVAEGSVEDGGTELMGMKHGGEETLEFQVPVAASPLLVHAIRISFQRPVLDQNKNVRVAVDRLTLVPRAR